ncbi:MAG: single-stranded-DNA-specific exonuclease RecJ [Symbiobacteriaceae bacterium]
MIPRRVAGRWRLRPAPQDDCERLQRELGIGPVAARVLVARGWREPDAVRRIWEGREPLHDPYLLDDLDQAVERIRRALRRGERIHIIGDYDVDGVAAAALLWRGLRQLEPGAAVDVYIPDRHREGYGISRAAIEAAREAGATLVITADNGIAAHQSLAEAARLGLDVIVTDHHQPQGELPPAVAVVNPHRPGSSYPNRHLCGAGVAFKLLQALVGGPPADPGLWQLVALATIADVVPLVDENRTLVRRGLEALAEAPLPGLAALAECAGLASTRLDAQTVAFTLAPRLNAAGRMGSALEAWELLATDSPERARALALAVDQLNAARRRHEEMALEQALQRLERGEGIYGDDIIALADPQWHLGVLGIVAARLVDLFHRPALVGRRAGGRVTGSARSIEGFHLFHALSSCADLFERFGGHAQAAGFTLPAALLPELGRRLAARARETLAPEQRVPVLDIDAVVRPEELTVAAVRELERLAPFGEGNPEPVLLLTGLPAGTARAVGSDGHHLRLEWPGGMSAVAFGLGQLAHRVNATRRLEVAVRPVVSDFRGELRVDLHVRGLRPAPGERERWLREELEQRRRWVDVLYPSREVLVRVFLALERLAAPDRSVPARSNELLSRLQRLLPRMPREGLQAAVQILAEAGVLSPAGPAGDRWRVADRGGPTFDLAASPRYRAGCARREVLERLEAALAEGRWEEAESGLTHPLVTVLPFPYNQGITNGGSPPASLERAR